MQEVKKLIEKAVGEGRFKLAMQIAVLKDKMLFHKGCESVLLDLEKDIKDENFL